MVNFAHGANRVHVGWGKVVLLSGICSGYLGLALGPGSIISSTPSRGVTRVICFVSLLLLGLIKLLDYNIKAYISRHCCIRRNLSFPLSGLKVIVNIYGDPMAANVDDSQSLEWKETVFLALAMSIDGLAVETMAALLDILVAAALALSSAARACMVHGDLRLERKAASRFRCNLLRVSGVLLMALVLMKVLP